MKEFLSRHQIEYLSRDVYLDPAAEAEHREMGFRSVPVFAVGDRHIYIQHVDQLRIFLGLPREEGPSASYQDWAVALRRVLEATEEAVAVVPAERLADPTPNRGRDLPELIVNIHEGIAAMRDSLDSGIFDWRTAEDFARSRRFRVPEELAAYCGETRRRWFRRASLVDDEDARNPVETPRGTITQSQLLESQAIHAAQHLRQIYLFLDQLGVSPKRKLAAEEMWPIRLGELLY